MTEPQPKAKPSAEVPIEPERFLTALDKAAAAQDLALSPAEQQSLCRYYERLVTVNRVMNLTGITEAAAVAEKHIVDSLVMLKRLRPFASLIDVGSGAGLPGVPLAVLRPQARTVLLDSQRKRCDFLQGLAAEIPLRNLETLWGRAEDFGQNPSYREQFDLAAARAVAPLPQLLEYLLPFVKPGGQVCALKGVKAEEEWNQSLRAAQLLGAEPAEIYWYQLAGERHALIILNKIGKTPDKYPRNAGTIKKSPL